MIRFYLFTQNEQNNDEFMVTDKLCHRLFIQAENYWDARTKAISLGVYFDGVDSGIDCYRCGDRWDDANYKIDIPHRFGAFQKEATYDLSVDKMIKYYGLDKETQITENADIPNHYDVIFNDIETVAQYYADQYGSTTPASRVFFIDGTVKEFNKTEKHNRFNQGKE